MSGPRQHRTGLPTKLLELFRARSQLPFSKPNNKKPPAVAYCGVANLVDQFAEPGDPEYEQERSSSQPQAARSFKNPEIDAQARIDIETLAEKHTRIAAAKKDKSERTIEEAANAYDPEKDPNIKGDAFRTLFVCRLSYEVDEKKLTAFFSEYGPVASICIVRDLNNKSRGYGFVEFEDVSSMKTAYKMSDGERLEGRRIKVDAERGRTVKNWRPRRLGGGLGGESRVTRQKGEKPKPSAPVVPSQPSHHPPARTPHAAPPYNPPPSDRRDRGRDNGMPPPSHGHDDRRGRDRDGRDGRPNRDGRGGYRDSRDSRDPREYRDHRDRDRGGDDRDRHRDRYRDDRPDRDRKRERDRDGFDRDRDAKRRSRDHDERDYRRRERDMF